VTLPKDYVEEVEKHWHELMDKGKPFSRGVVFTISSIEKDKENADIFVKATDYAHYLCTTYKGNFTESDCRVIHTSALIETLDKKYVLGEMNITTSAPHRLQFIGGGLDKGDIKGDIVDLEHNMRKEISEELGIDVNNSGIVKKLEPCYLESGGDSSFLSAVFKLELLIDENELLDIFNKHNEHQISQGISPELISLIFIPADKESVEQFIANESREINHNVIPIFKVATGLCEIDDLGTLK
jgi:8-oxo-dGTP pyrophosphatase MutT (NUDIX family)